MKFATFHFLSRPTVRYAGEGIVLVWIVLILCWQSMHGQTVNRGGGKGATDLTNPKKEEAAPKVNEGDFWEQQALFRKQAKAALDREESREMAGDCPKPMPTADEVFCLG